MCVFIGDALIRLWSLIGRRPTIGWLSSFGWYWLIQKKLILLSYLSYLFRLRLLFEDLLTWRTAECRQNKNAPKSKVWKHSHFDDGDGMMMLVLCCTMSLMMQFV